MKLLKFDVYTTSTYNYGNWIQKKFIFYGCRTIFDRGQAIAIFRINQSQTAAGGETPRLSRPL